MHAGVHECAKYGRGKFLFTERPPHVGVDKDVYGATGSEIGIPLATHAMGFTFVDQGDPPMFYGDGDGGGLAVVEGLRGRTNHELFEMPYPDIAHADDFHEAVIDECLQMVCIPAASSLAGFQLDKNCLSDHHLVREGAKNLPRAA
jgi:hypothetical protein